LCQPLLPQTIDVINVRTIGIMSIVDDIIILKTDVFGPSSRYHGIDGSVSDLTLYFENIFWLMSKNTGRRAGLKDSHRHRLVAPVITRSHGHKL